MRLQKGVHAFLDASTAHITRSDNDILQEWARMEPAESPRAAPYRTIAHSYGFFVHVQHDDVGEYEEQATEDGISDSFLTLQRKARELGCWWINLDRDADTLGFLPTHNW